MFLSINCTISKNYLKNELTSFAVFVRFVDEWQILQRLIRVQLFVKSMTGEEIARELVNALSVEYGIGVNRLLAAMHDRPIQLP